MYLATPNELQALPTGAAEPAETGGGDQGGWAPPPGWPASEQIRYWRDLISLALITLALPWVLVRLFTDPAGLLEDAGRHHA